MLQKNMLVRIHPENPQPRLVQQIVTLLHNDGIIIYPTDSVYGMGCCVSSAKAAKRMSQIREKPIEAFSIVCRDIRQMADYADISNMQYRVLNRFLPGPYTFLLPAARRFPKTLVRKSRVIGVRVPDNNIVQEILNELGEPLLNTSLPVVDDWIMNDPGFIHDHFERQVECVIDGGSGVLFSEPSSVISLIDDAPEVVRDGRGDCSWI
jgi:tRNA threonylcarbamoyl adenosine modification protein (Sua5/YciO/YrdC/YwlC family)